MPRVERFLFRVLPSLEIAKRISAPRSEIYLCVDQLRVNVKVIRGKMNEKNPPEWFIRLDEQRARMESGLSGRYRQVWKSGAGREGVSAGQLGRVNPLLCVSSTGRDELLLEFPSVGNSERSRETAVIGGKSRVVGNTWGTRICTVSR
jgi:hypothetical protein